LRYFQARLESVILVEPAQQPTKQVLFGATVKVEDENGDSKSFTIVGEDEADIASGTSAHRA
jgi:transcription elongation GreA/GreB family factor